MKSKFSLGLAIFLTPVLLWLFLLIVIPHLELLLMSLQGENDMGDPIYIQTPCSHIRGNQDIDVSAFKAVNRPLSGILGNIPV